MTDRTGDEAAHPAAAALVDRPLEVPGDTEWTLETQVPFEAGGRHDLTAAIIVGVATAEDVSPKAITEPPLYEILDVAALEAAFFGSTTIGRHDDSFRSVEFMYRGHRVVVRSDAWVQVYRPVEG